MGILLKTLCAAVAGPGNTTNADGERGRNGTSSYSPRVVLAMVVVSAILLLTAPRDGNNGGVKLEEHYHVRGGHYAREVGDGTITMMGLNDVVPAEQDEFALLETEVTMHENQGHNGRRLSETAPIANAGADDRTTAFISTLKRLESKLVIRNMIKRMVQGDQGKGSINGSSNNKKQQRRANEVASEAHGSTEASTHNTGEVEREVSIETDFWSIYKALVFLVAIYVAGQSALLVGMPALFGEIVAGFLLGPPLADFVPYPESFVLIGEIGLIMLLLEAGIDIDVAQLKVTGLRAILIAFTGAFGSLGVGIGLSYAMGVTGWQAAIALGATFAPTSLAVASNALGTGKVLNTPVGQLIVASCVIDDVIGLVILSVLEVLVEEEAKIHQYFLPLISAVIFLGGLGYVAIIWMPIWVDRFIYRKLPEAWHTPVCFTLMIVLLMAYMPLMFVSKASYLTGAFLAGLSFSQIPPIHHAFIHYTSNLFAWLLRIFFSSSIGFQVPITLYKDPKIVGWGFAFYIAVLAKLPLGLYSPRFTAKVPANYPFDPYWRDVILTGIAMTSRGEFSFIIASFAINSGLANTSEYAAVVWAVLLSCATSPFMLLSTIKYYNNLLEGLSGEIEDMSVPKDRKVPLYLSIQARTGVVWGLRDKLDRAVDDLGLLTIDHRSWHPRGLNATVVTEMYVQDSTIMLTVPMEDVDAEKADDTTKLLLDKDSKDKDETPEGPIEEVATAVHAQFDQEAENELVAARCEEVRLALLKALETTDAEIQVTEWRPAKFMRKHDKPQPGDGEEGGSTGDEDDEDEAEQAALIREQVQRQLEHKELIDTNLDLYPSKADDYQKKLRTKTVSGPIAPASNTERFTLNLDDIGEDQSTDGGAGGVTSILQTTAPGFERPSPAAAATFSGALNYVPTADGAIGAGPGVGADAEGLVRPSPTTAVSSSAGFGLQRRPTAPSRQRQKQVSTPYTAKRSMWDTDEAAQQAAFEGVEATAAVLPETVGGVSGTAYGARLQRNQPAPRRRKMKSEFFMDRIKEEMPTVEERLGGIVRQELRTDSITGESVPVSRMTRQRQSSFSNMFPSSNKKS